MRIKENVIEVYTNKQLSSLEEESKLKNNLFYDFKMFEKDRYFKIIPNHCFNFFLTDETDYFS